MLRTWFGKGDRKSPNPVAGPVTEEPTGRLCALHTGRQVSVKSRSCAPSPPRQLLTDVRERALGEVGAAQKCDAACVRACERGEESQRWDG